MTEQDSATVLIVDDENDIVEIFALGLKDEYNVIKAYSGQEALDKISNDVDVVLLDRRMPEMTGKEVLSEIRERELNVRVAMVTAVDPDFDITEMGFDTYIQKPVDTDELKDVVSHLLRLSNYDDQLLEQYSLAKKQATLKAEKSASELQNSEEYQALVEKYKAIQEETNETIQEMDHDEVKQTLQNLDDPNNTDIDH